MKHPPRWSHKLPPPAAQGLPAGGNRSGPGGCLRLRRSRVQSPEQPQLRPVHTVAKEPRRSIKRSPRPAAQPPSRTVPERSPQLRDPGAALSPDRARAQPPPRPCPELSPQLRDQSAAPAPGCPACSAMAGPEEEEGSPAEDAPGLDPRVRLLGERVLRSLRLKPERWERCVGSPEAQPLLRGFLEGAAGQPPLLVVTLSPAGQLALSTQLPASPGRSKALFFLRRGPGPLSAPPGPGELLYGDLPASSLEHFATLVEEVVAPVLANQKNHHSWPHVVSQDIMRHVHSLKSNIFVVIGQVKGKTLLPLPAGSERMEYIDCENEKTVELVDKSLVHAIESTVIEWSYQIQGALKRESSEPLLQGSNPNPKVELEFWKNRCVAGSLAVYVCQSKLVLHGREMLQAASTTQTRYED
ncbi:dynein heavy chain 9, axonemal-like [Trachemys scripta elegans]|uniref:dynein heavy chain 9, axonemal-like n=1 Tax=Trachemys scripta elegans TaxID=31138 RepID=UPI00155164DB|nr:dynein heavy chain 9, axonemal-like [Trachemys scripta elegans]